MSKRKYKVLSESKYQNFEGEMAKIAAEIAGGKQEKRCRMCENLRKSAAGSAWSAAVVAQDRRV